MYAYSDWLLVSDIDGTLLNKKRQLPDINKAAIKRFVENGGNFTLCSGRNLDSLYTHYKNIGVETPAICMNGALIYDFASNSVLSFDTISSEGEKLILSLFDKFKFIQLTVFSIDTLYLYKYTCFYGLAVSMLDKLKRCICKTAGELPYGKWGKATIMAMPSTCKQIVEFLKNEENSKLVDCFYTSPVTVEIVKKGVNKGTAVEKLAEMLGVGKSKVAAIGDYYNDEAMLRTVSHPVCCGQAPDDLKQICEYITCHCNHGAVSDFINYIEKTYINGGIIMQKLSKNELAKVACKVRKGIIEGTFNAKSGHPGGSLSIAEIISYLYFNEMNIDPADPVKADRDRFVLSKGHAAPALYSVMAQRGYFPVEELKTLRKVDSRLQGHPSMHYLPGVDISSGSLGQGISAACGMALGAKLKGAAFRVYTILGDGEIEEGQVWEAAMYAAAKKLDNLVAFVDNNNLQIDGTVEEVNSPYPIPEKFAAFGWNVIEIDGHSFDEIENALNAARACKGKPTAIVAETVKGKGVSFMENQVNWHGSAPNAEQYEFAMNELDAQLAELEG